MLEKLKKSSQIQINSKMESIDIHNLVQIRQ